MLSPRKPGSPPLKTNLENRPRQVGVEIEFAGVEVKKAAELVVDLFGGKANEVSPYRFKVEKTKYGIFEIELDSQYAHPSDLKNFPQELEEAKETVRKLDEQLSQAIGQISEGVVPYEIICPPIPWNKLDTLNPLFSKLRKEGAKGTKGNPLYAFGLHLNPEVAKKSASYILAHLQAFIILSDFLRAEIEVDFTRKVLPHTNPFPKRYAKQILGPDYKPDLKKMISDYLEANPTRNRDLDLLPLFAFLDGKQVRKKIDDPRIKPRPTFHYRLPNSSLSKPGWNAVTEWNRWLSVERLAKDKAKLKKAAQAYLEFHTLPLKTGWAEKAKEFA